MNIQRCYLDTEMFLKYYIYLYFGLQSHFNIF